MNAGKVSQAQVRQALKTTPGVSVERRRRSARAKATESDLKRMLQDAGRDAKAEALDALFKSLRPALYELMKIKGWNARKVARFLRERNFVFKGAEIEARLKAGPLDESDKAALESLKAGTAGKASEEAGQ